MSRVSGNLHEWAATSLRRRHLRGDPTKIPRPAASPPGDRPLRHERAGVGTAGGLELDATKAAADMGGTGGSDRTPSTCDLSLCALLYR